MACSCRGTRTSRVCSPHCACICASAVSRRVRLFMAVKADSSAPTKTGDIDRSMSSEKRSITPYTFDSDVPPVNTRCGAGAGSAKSSPSNPLTQKSFSTITLDTAMRAAVCVNASASPGWKRYELRCELRHRLATCPLPRHAGRAASTQVPRSSRPTAYGDLPPERCA